MNKFFLIGGLTLAVALSSCSTTVRTVPVDELSGEWTVESIDGKQLNVSADEQVPYIAFDVVNKRVFGSLGCNRMMGGLNATDKGDIEFGNMGATMMMCPDMETETSMLAALNKVNKFGMDKDGALVLLDGSKHMVTLVKNDNAFSPASLVGKWKINNLGDLDLSGDTEETYTVEFLPDGHFSMTTGCNNVGGSYSGKFVDMSFSDLMSTRMACPDMQVETLAQQLLPTVTSISELAKKNTVGFYDAENNMVMILERIAE